MAERPATVHLPDPRTYPHDSFEYDDVSPIYGEITTVLVKKITTRTYSTGRTVTTIGWVKFTIKPRG